MMKRLTLLWLSIFCAGCQYGPEQDHSRFKSAALIQSGRTVVFTFHDLVYRPAEGLSAFPDGGIPKYITDTSYVCAFDRETGKLKKIMESENKEWTHGSGAFHIVTARGSSVLVSQSGQKRRDLGTVLTRHHILNVATGARETFNLSADLRKLGRKKGSIYLCDDTGTLLIIIRSEHQASSGFETPEIWVRQTGGHYILAGSSAHYQEILNGEVVFWSHKDRRYYAYGIKTGITRHFEGYNAPAGKNILEAASVGSAGASVDIGARMDGSWQYEPLPITPSDVRNL